MKDNRINWTWRGQSIEIGLETRGKGPVVLMLPALSSISTRAEMRPLAEQLASTFSTIAIDWPGFGDLPRPPMAWEPAAYREFLSFILKTLEKTIRHGGGGTRCRLRDRACDCTSRFGWPALPRRANMARAAADNDGRRRPVFRYVSRLVDLPVIGAALYRLNVNSPMIRMMGRGHVYSDPAWLDGPRLAEKLAVTAAPGARHASFRFVAGELDPMPTRNAFLAAAREIVDPILIVYGANTPPRSKGEMEALASVPGIQLRELPAGKLAAHEEFPTLVGQALLSFLGENRD